MGDSQKSPGKASDVGVVRTAPTTRVFSDCPAPFTLILKYFRAQGYFDDKDFTHSVIDVMNRIRLDEEKDCVDDRGSEGAKLKGAKSGEEFLRFLMAQ